MKILVCISNVPDTTTKIRFTEGNTKFDVDGVQWVINPWDELALTRAVELKEQSAGSIEQITVINAGPESNDAILRKALRIGADDAIRIDTEASDAYYVARQLAAYAGGYDLIMAGIETSDYNGNAVGAMLAEMMDIESVSGLSGLDMEEGGLVFTRDIDGGVEKLKLNLPVVAIVQKGIAKKPRIPAMRDIVNARKKKLEVKTAVSESILTEFQSYELPPAKSACKMVDEDQAAEIIRLLREEAKVL